MDGHDVDRTVRFDHLAHLTTPTGLFEHALGTEPRPEHGMCVDDVARALVVTSRTTDPTDAVTDMSATYLRFLRAAQQSDGPMHNRRTTGGEWIDAASSGDHWGRALWALGTAAAHLPASLADVALRGAHEAMPARSPHPRAMAYAVLGAVQLLRVRPQDVAARGLLEDARAVLPGPGADPDWPWPYPRLTYANAVLPEAMIAAGVALLDDRLVGEGLELLGWLVQEQTVGGHLSVVPAGGRGPGAPRPGFDQQPIEVAALAEAARTAFLATGDGRWFSVLESCVAWFEGANDTGLPVRDAVTGGGFDGLMRLGVNQNQGAESTLAWLSCVQMVQPLPAEAAR